MKQENFKKFKERRFEFFLKLRLKNIFPGEWKSIYKGAGIEFADKKPFEPGDDLRRIDFQTLAQTGEEKVIQREVERQLKIYLWVDFSGSLQKFEHCFFSSKSEIRAVATGLLLFSSQNIYSPVGFCAFSEDIKKFFPAKRGEQYCWEILKSFVEEESKEIKTEANFHQAFSFLVKSIPIQSMIFFISDFQDRIFEGDFTNLLQPVVAKFDFIPVIIQDPLEKFLSIKRSIRIKVIDSEGLAEQELYLTPKKLKEIQEISKIHLLNLEHNFKKLGLDHLVLSFSSSDFCQRAFYEFFQTRKRLSRTR